MPRWAMVLVGYVMPIVVLSVAIAFIPGRNLLVSVMGGMLAMTAGVMIYGWAVRRYPRD